MGAPRCSAKNGLKGSANCSLKANQSAKSVRSPVSRISRKFIGGWKRTATFATNTRAREEQADKFFKECIEIADAATQENCNVARLRVDTRKWAAARLAPKKYGDHINHDVKGGTNVNFQPQILIQCSSDEGEGFIDVRAAPEAAGGVPQQGNGNLVRGR